MGLPGTDMAVTKTGMELPETAGIGLPKTVMVLPRTQFSLLNYSHIPVCTSCQPPTKSAKLAKT